MTVPPGRGRWRLVLAERLYDQTRQDTPSLVLGDLVGARSRRVEQELNGPAKLTFVLDGRDPAAALIDELQHEVRVFRWDDEAGRDAEMLRAIITHAQDTISEQRHSVTFTAYDPLKMLARRWLTQPLNFTQVEQDTIVDYLRSRGSADLATSGGFAFGLGADLPLAFTAVDPAGNPRPASGRRRDRSYPQGTNCFEAMGNLAAVIDGFDFDTVPPAGYHMEVDDQLRVFYPYRGFLVEDFMFEYGSTVASLDRTVSSDTFANYFRIVGESEPDAPQIYGEAYDTAAGNIVTNPAGVWMQHLSASDVKVQATLVEQAVGELARSILIPAYNLRLTPGVYSPGMFDLGDTVRLRVRTGRLDVDTWVRVIGRNFVIGDDGQEDVEVDVGRPPANLFDQLRSTDRRLAALERR